MQMKDIISVMSNFVKQWFHKRNIIIVSEHKVNHIPIGGTMQFAVLTVIVCGICWASYSTGSSAGRGRRAGFFAAFSFTGDDCRLLRNRIGFFKREPNRCQRGRRCSPDGYSASTVRTVLRPITRPS